MNIDPQRVIDNLTRTVAEQAKHIATLEAALSQIMETATPSEGTDTAGSDG